MKVQILEDVKDTVSYEISKSGDVICRVGDTTKLVITYVENTATCVFLTKNESETIYMSIFEEKSFVRVDEKIDIHVSWYEDETSTVEPCILISRSEN